MLKKLGWDKDLTEAEMAISTRSTPPIRTRCRGRLDLSGGIQRVALKHGCVPYGNGKARMNAFGLPDPIPVHREPIYTPRVDLVSKYPTLPDAKQFRLPNIGFSVQKAAVDKGIAKQFPLILSSGRLVEYEGGGEETRSNKWLAELQQDMFIEINPADAAERGIKDGGWVWVTGAENSSQGQGEGAGHRARRQGRRLDAVPLRRLVRRARICAATIRRALIRSCSAKAPTRSPPTATIRRPACRSPKSLSVRSRRHKEERPWHE